MRDLVTLPLEHISDVGAARHVAVGIARARGFVEVDLGRVALVATEAATNTVRHAVGGAIHVRSADGGDTVGIELLVTDKGPGMPRVAESMRDGFSTASTLGFGLGAIARQSDDFDLYSDVQSGTILFSRIWKSRPSARPPRRAAVGGIALPATGEDITGDAWCVEQKGTHVAMLLVDGTGHGPGAAEAAHVATTLFHERAGCTIPPEDIVQEIHDCLNGTRGGAVAVAVANLAESSVRFCGIGNVVAFVGTESSSKHMISQPGVAGGVARRLHPETYDIPVGAAIVMFSDGLRSSAGLSRYPQILRRHPAIAAAAMIRDFRRGADDASVLIVKPLRVKS